MSPYFLDNFLFYFSFFLIFLLALFVFSPTTIISLKNNAPLVPTPKKKIRDALKLADLKEGEVFYDLGSGTGRSLIIAEKEFGAKAKGIEHSLMVSLLSRLNLLINFSKGRIARKNLFDADLSDANVIFIYSSPKIMKEFEKSFYNLKKGTRVVSYAFSFPNISPNKKMDTPMGNIHLYKR